MKINYKKIGILLLTGSMMLTCTACPSTVIGKENKENKQMEQTYIPEETTPEVIETEEVINPEEVIINNGIEEQQDKEFYDVCDQIYTITTLNFRTEPNLESNIMTTIEPYQKLFRLTTNDSWNLVKFNEIEGYVSSDYIAKLPDKYVEVDISDQKVYLYNYNEELVNSSVVTGKDLTPTRLGYFSIYLKQKNTYLVGPGYNSHVNYWMPFDGGIGLHDASWRDNFGGDIYKLEGSHGCVNLPNDTAETVYENTEVGTKVLVHN